MRRQTNRGMSGVGNTKAIACQSGRAVVTSRSTHELHLALKRRTRRPTSRALRYAVSSALSGLRRTVAVVAVYGGPQAVARGVVAPGAVLPFEMHRALELAALRVASRRWTAVAGIEVDRHVGTARVVSR